MALRPYDPVGAMGGLFAPALIRGNRVSERAFDEWMARNLKRPPAPDTGPPAPPAPTMAGPAPESPEEAAARQRDAIAKTIMMLQGGDQGSGGAVSTAPLDPNLADEGAGIGGGKGPFSGAPWQGGTPPPAQSPPPSAPPVSTPVTTPPATPPTDNRGVTISPVPPGIPNVHNAPYNEIDAELDAQEAAAKGGGRGLNVTPQAIPNLAPQKGFDPDIDINVPVFENDEESPLDVQAPPAPQAVEAVAAPSAPGGKGIGSDVATSANAAAAAAAAAAATGTGPPGMGIGSPMAGPAQSYGGFGPASSGPAAAAALTGNAFGLGGLMAGTPGVSATGHIGTTGMGLLSGTAVNSGQTTPAPDPGLFGLAYGTAPPGSPSGGFVVGQAPSGSVFGDNPYGGMPGEMTAAPGLGYGGGGFEATPGGGFAPGSGYSADSPYGGGYGGTNSSGFGAEANAAVDVALGSGLASGLGEGQGIGTGGYGGNTGAVGAALGGLGYGGTGFGGNAGDAGLAGGFGGYGGGGYGDAYGGGYGDAPSGPSDVALGGTDY